MELPTRLANLSEARLKSAYPNFRGLATRAAMPLD